LKNLAAAADFRLSRIYAQGWNAARALDSTEQVNPYPNDPERRHWLQGFSDARTGGRKTAG
jgi:ribosome modulation factor